MATRSRQADVECFHETRLLSDADDLGHIDCPGVLRTEVIPLLREGTVSISKLQWAGWKGIYVRSPGFASSLKQLEAAMPAFQSLYLLPTLEHGDKDFDSVIDIVLGSRLQHFAVGVF